MTTSTTPHAAFTDPRVTRVREYQDGWVPSSYRWPAPGAMVEHTRLEDGSYETTTGTYDRKRTGGRGPLWVAFSARGGRLASV